MPDNCISNGGGFVIVVVMWSSCSGTGGRRFVMWVSVEADTFKDEEGWEGSVRKLYYSHK